MIISYKGKTPRIAESAYIAPNATVIGDVEIGEGSSVWFGAVIRGDNDPIIIGENSNIQDGCTLHSDEGSPITIGDNVTVGHNAIIHGCTIESCCLIGMGAIVLNDARIKKGSLVGAGALVTEGKEFEENSLIVGFPAKAKGQVTPEQTDMIMASAAEYAERKLHY